MKYRAEIDGLRAFAVVPVILFHAGFEIFSGGFVGVDLFFVISGYLITSILIEDIENKRFSIVSFYERRARRILPALFLVMLVCIPFAWELMLPSQMKDFSQSLVAVSLFSSNILFWRESGYFDEATEEKPLLHTWSLAVEEQYYLLFPLFLLLSWRFGRHRVFWMIVVMATISLLISEWGWRHKPNANFFFSPTRAWELFAGSIAAFVVSRRGVRSNDLLASLGFCAIVFSIFFYDENVPFPSIYSLVPILGVVLVVLYAGEATLTSKMLSNKAFVGIGLISYSAYLWHQPLFAFARMQSFGSPSGLAMFLLSAITMVLAYISWRYIETPFRKKNVCLRKTVFLGSVIGITAFSTAGATGHLNSKALEEAWIERQGVEYQKLYSMLEYENRIHRKSSNISSIEKHSECRFNVRSLDEKIEKKLLQCSIKYGSGVLILGDSHAIDLFGIVTTAFDNPFVVGITQAGCRPHTPEPHCHYDRVKTFIKSQKNVFYLAIYEQAGFYLLKKKDGTKGSRALFKDLDQNSIVRDIVVDEEHVRSTSKFLFEISKDISVKWFLPRAEPHIHRSFVLEKGCGYPYRYRKNQFETFENLDDYIEELVASSLEGKVTAVNQNDMFNFKFPDDFMSCDALYWNDGDHYSSSGEVYFSERLPNSFLLL